LNFAWLNTTEDNKRWLEQFAAALNQRAGLSLPADYAGRYVTLGLNAWSSRIDTLIEVLEEALL
jgi:hypothetical protein